MVTRGGGEREGELDEGVKRDKLPVMRYIGPGDVTYSMIAVINTAVCYI